MRNEGRGSRDSALDFMDAVPRAFVSCVLAKSKIEGRSSAAPPTESPSPSTILNVKKLPDFQSIELKSSLWTSKYLRWESWEGTGRGDEVLLRPASPSTLTKLGSSYEIDKFLALFFIYGSLDKKRKNFPCTLFILYYFLCLLYFQEIFSLEHLWILQNLGKLVFKIQQHL